MLLRTKTILRGGNGGGRTVAETTQGTFMRGLEVCSSVSGHIFISISHSCVSAEISTAGSFESWSV